MAGDHSVRGSDYHSSRLLRDQDGRTGRFKHLRNDAPAVENYTLGIEWIAYALGTVLGVPVAPIYLEWYSGIPGALSPILPDSLDWKLVYEKGITVPPVTNVDDLPLSVVFDIWIANCDRWDPNLLVQSDPVGTPVANSSRVKVWLIDHGFCFLWPPVKYGLKDDGSDLDQAVIDNGDTLAERRIRERMTDGKSTRGYWATFKTASEDERQRLYAKVKAVGDDTIETAVRQVSGSYIGQRLMELTVQQLKARRDRVDEIAERLLTS